MSDDLRHALQTLIESDGWKLVQAMAKQVWGAHTSMERLHAAQKVDGVDALGVETARVLAARDAVDQVLAWPRQELKRLEKAAAGVPA